MRRKVEDRGDRPAQRLQARELPDMTDDLQHPQTVRHFCDKAGPAVPRRDDTVKVYPLAVERQLALA